MSLTHDLVCLLADGRFHSGTAMGSTLGVTRAAVCKAIGRLAASGLEVDRVPGRGYRVPGGLQPLDMARIEPALEAGWPDAEQRLWLLAEVDSTNQWLLRQPQHTLRCGLTCIAEAQLAGRGRHGRQWISPAYRDVMLSVGWWFDSGATVLSGLSLAAGVAVATCLRDAGCDRVVLKWPNDLYIGDRKLGGLLVDIRGEATGRCWVVLGLGINLYPGARIRDAVDRPWTALAEHLAAIDRNQLVADLVSSIWKMFQLFEREGFAAFRAQWERMHGFDGRRVTVHGHNESFAAVILGVSDEGQLRVRDDADREHRVNAGEVSLGTMT